MDNCGTQDVSSRCLPVAEPFLLEGCVSALLKKAASPAPIAMLKSGRLLAGHVYAVPITPLKAPEPLEKGSLRDLFEL